MCVVSKGEKCCDAIPSNVATVAIRWNGVATVAIRWLRKISAFNRRDRRARNGDDLEADFDTV